jgi:YVTN family beta-propeller protein
VAVWLLVQVMGSTRGPLVTATVHVGGLPRDAAIDPTGDLWVADIDGGRLSRIDHATNSVANVVPSVGGGADVGSIAFGEGSMWAGVSGRLLRIDPGSGKQLAAIPIGVGSVAFGAGAVWVAMYGDNPDTGGCTLGRIDPSSNRVVATIPVVCPRSVAADDSAVWVAGPDSVVRIDPATNRVVATVGLGGYPNGAEVAIGAGAVWVAYWGFPLRGGALTGHLVRIDPATNRIVADIPVRGANGLAVGVDTVWIATGRSVVRVDARSNAVVSQVMESLAVGVDGVAVDEHTVWAWSTTGSDTVWRIAY